MTDLSVFALLEMLVSFGATIGFCCWQIWTVRPARTPAPETTVASVETAGDTRR